MLNSKSKQSKKLFKHASLVDLQTGDVRNVDIVVDGQKIAEIVDEKMGFDGEVFDVGGNFLLPAFANAYSDCVGAIEKHYGLELVGKTSEKLYGFWRSKNLLSGIAFLRDRNVETNSIFLENLQDLSEKQLDEISIQAHKKNIPLFINVGRTLEELGSIDKIHHKPVSQVLEDFGLLEDNPTIVGANCLEKDELQLLKNYDCKIITTPFDDARLGRRPLNMIMLKNLGFEVEIGSGESTEIDFFAYVRQILMNNYGLFENNKILCEQEVLQMAVGGNLRLEVGMQANFMVVEKSPTFYDDIFKTLVWEKGKRDVLLCVGQGEILCDRGKINQKSIDEEKIMLKNITRRTKNDN